MVIIKALQEIWESLQSDIYYKGVKMNSIKEKERFDKLEKEVKLMADLLGGRESGEKEGYISIDDIRKKYK